MFVNNHPLGRMAKLRSWSRVLRWQIGCRILPFPIEVPWLEGSVLIMERGLTGATGNWYCGLHEFSDMALLLHYFGAEDAEGGFMDIGANIGSYTILAAAVCGQKCISLEPLPNTHQRLLRNIRANNVMDIVDAPCSAAGALSGRIRFTCDLDTMNHVVGEDYEGNVTEVPVFPLDELVQDAVVIPSFWKIDVEGFEREVLDGATRSLADPKVQVVLLEDDDTEIRELMVHHGFQRASYDPFSRCLSIGADARCANNHIWVREPKEVERRCNASRRYEVLGIEF